MDRALLEEDLTLLEEGRGSDVAGCRCWKMEVDWIKTPIGRVVIGRIGRCWMSLQEVDWTLLEEDPTLLEDGRIGRG